MSADQAEEVKKGMHDDGCNGLAVAMAYAPKSTVCMMDRPKRERPRKRAALEGGQPSQPLQTTAAQTAAAGAGSMQIAAASEAGPHPQIATPYVVNGVAMTEEQYVAWQQLERPVDTGDA